MTKRLKILLTLALATGLLAAIFGNRISTAVTAQLLLRQPAPNPVAVREIFATHSESLFWLQRFWDTEKLPHRYLVLSHLKETASQQPLEPKAKQIVIEALYDVDNGVRELALGLLDITQPDDFEQHLQRQLRDTDQALKIKVLRYLRAEDHRALLPDVIALLDDREPTVQASAASLLRRWTGNDFGMRNVDAVSKTQDTGPRTISKEGRQRLTSGISQWKAWWQEHRPSQVSVAPNISGVKPKKVATSDFTLASIEGEQVSLSDFRGRVVVLNFWTTWCTACSLEMPDLVELTKRHSDDLVILGIALDGSDGHGHDHAAFVDLDEANERGWDAVPGLNQANHDDHDGHNHDEEIVDLDRIKKKIRRTIQRKNLNYPILLNPTGSIGNRFNGHELPTNVLIDKEGFVRRRFIGSRPLATWEAMIAEIQ